MRVMNICISFSILVADFCTSKIGNDNAANPARMGKTMIIKNPAKPWNKAPSPNPPVTKMTEIAEIRPNKIAPPTYRIRNLVIGISKRRIATCQIGILSIISSPNYD